MQSYRGTVFLVSHDRRFVDSVVTSTIAWEGDSALGGHPGLWREYEGGIEDWIVQRNRAKALQSATVSTGAAASIGSSAQDARAAWPAPLQGEAAARVTGGDGPSPAAAGAPKRKLSYKEQRELDALPALIDGLEAEQAQISEALADGSLFASDLPRATALTQRSAAIEDELMQALERWELLGSR